MSDWHYFATRLNGDGTETLLANELPLVVGSFTHSLSAPNTMSATIPVEVLHLRGEDGEPIFKRWSTAIYAEKDGLIRWGGVLTGVVETGQGISLEADGFVAYAYGQPYLNDRQFIDVDPLFLARHIWEHLQSFDGGNLAVVLDETTSPVRVGTPLEDVEFETDEGTVSFEAGPYRLNFFSTHDLGGVFDDLAEATPFDYAEVHEWQGETIRHRIRLGYPALGRQRTDLRYVVGENIFTEPTVEQNGEAYASSVVVLGSGEGRKMVRGEAGVNEPDGLRRIRVITDKSATTPARAARVATIELRALTGAEEVSSFTIADHPNAPIAALSVGDEVLIQGGGAGWAGDLYLWVRVLEITTAPDSETATISVTRTERTT